jgi:hypothetical protein
VAIGNAVFQETENSIVVSVPANKKRKRFAKLTLTQTAVKEEELVAYLPEPLCNENDDPLAYWRTNKTRFPLLAKFSKNYLGLQTTSKEVEGAFSK